MGSFGGVTSGRDFAEGVFLIGVSSFSVLAPRFSLAALNDF